MKSCSLNNFIEEINPWLDQKYIHKALTDGKGNFIIYFLDGTKNTYAINDCNEKQVLHLLHDLKEKGITIEH
jgi:hypothetical protein